jgi:hypothetical protein
MRNILNFTIRICCIASVSASVAVVVMAGVFAVNAAILTHGHERVRAAIEGAVADGSIRDTGGFGPISLLSAPMKREIYAHDCLLWTTILVPATDLLAMVFRTPRLDAAEGLKDPRAPGNPDCQAVLQFLDGDASSAKPTLVYYDRYILAQRAIIQLLLEHFSVRTAMLAPKFTTISAFVLVFLWAWHKRAFEVGALAALFLLFFGLSHFGGMLYFAPIDVTHAMVLLFAISRPIASTPPRILALLGALYGSFVAIFEVLIGGIPMALVLLSLLTGISAESRRSFIHGISLLVFSFAVAVIACFAIKLLVVQAIFGGNAFTDYFGPLLHRLHGDFIPEANQPLLRYLSDRGVDIETLVAYPILYMVASYTYWSRLIGWGSSVFGVALVATGMILLLGATLYAFRRKRRQSVSIPPSLFGCWLGVGILLLWISLFWNHTMLHAFFMARLLLIPILCGAVAILGVIYPRRSAEAQSSQANDPF